MDYAAPEARVAQLPDHEFQAPPRPAPLPPTLSGFERSVIRLSRKDPLASIPDLQGWRVGVARLFTAKRANPLANPRLEELRRFAILARTQDDPDDDALDRFLDAGYTLEQAELVRRILREGASVGRRTRPGLTFWVMPLLIAAGIYCVMQNAVHDFAISLIVAGLGLITVASLAMPHRRTHS
jgi:hypothetical protein